MNVDIFYGSLSSIEKEQLFDLLITDKTVLSNRNLTPVSAWLIMHPETSVRLCNVLISSDFKFIEQITKDNFLVHRNAGRRSLNEFIEIREKERIVNQKPER